MYKAVFIDIDGTLIRSDHSLSQATIDTIKEVKEKGIKVVLVSARPLHGITSISRQLLYPKKHTLSIDDNNGWYQVHLKLFLK